MMTSAGSTVQCGDGGERAKLACHCVAVRQACPLAEAVDREIQISRRAPGMDRPSCSAAERQMNCSKELVSDIAAAAP